MTRAPLYLKRLVLSEFRSIASVDLSIPAQAGVVIVQGSNGLGKSSLFHAMEWLLTNRVESFHLVDPRRPPASYLCRWEAKPHATTSTSMTFSDDQVLTRTLNGSSAGASNFSGPEDLASYLMATSWQASISDLGHYLLLTHFLSQATLARLQHREGELRFEVLKDAAQSQWPQRIADSLHGVEQSRPARAFKTLKQQLDAEISNCQLLLDQEQAAWRDVQTSGAIDDAEATTLGLEIARIIAAVESDPVPFPASADVSPSALADVLDRAKLTNERGHLDLTRGREIVRRLRVVDTDQAALRDAAATTKARLDFVQGEAKTAETAKLAAAAVLESATEALAKAQARDAQLRELTAVRTQYKAIASDDPSSTSEATMRLHQAETVIKAIQRRRQILDRLGVTGLALAETKTSIVRRRAHLAQVRESEDRLEPLRAAVADLKQAHPDLEALLAKAIADAEASRQAVATLQGVVEALGQAADVIAGAVTTISTHLPSDACDCPVCASPFPTPDELRARMSTAINHLAPEIGRQQARLQEAQRRERTATERAEQLKMIEGRLGVAQQALDAETEHRQNLGEEGESLGFPKAVVPHVVDAALDEEEIALERRAARLRRWQGRLDGEEISVSSLASATRAREEASRDLEALERTRADRARQREWLNLEDERLCDALFGTPIHDQAMLDAAVSSAADVLGHARPALDGAQAAVTAVDEAWNRLCAEQANLEARVQAAVDQTAELQREADALVDEWRALGLSPAERRPSMDDLDRADERLIANQKRLSDAAIRLERLRMGRQAWLRQGEHHKALERLRSRLGAAPNHTRDQLRADAQDRVDRLARRAAATLTAKSVALSASVAITRDLEVFNADYIRPLSKLMDRINRAILCDPTIGVDFQVGRKRVDQSARKGTRIPADRGSLDPRLVHSEGQMSALAVSLLCAASLTFPWSRWKALVLDDPLQANDAIHASAFADFVGNLVAFDDYQVLMSTHDLAQAQFLRRKFESRHIPCTLVSLVGEGETGVKAVIEPGLVEPVEAL